MENTAENIIFHIVGLPKNESAFVGVPAKKRDR